RVFAYMAGVTLLAGCVAGAAPALETLKRRLSPSKNRTTDVLVTAQVAMSLVVLIGAAVFLRGEQAMRTANPGYDIAHLLVASPAIAIPPHTAESADVFYRALTERVRGLHGVRSVSLTSAPPISDGE